MATTMSLAQFRTAVRQRTNNENATGVYTNSFITDAELNSYINQSIFELYDILIQKFGSEYFVANPSTITTDGVNSLFNLPADFYKLIGVALQINGSSYVPLKQGSMAEMLALQGVVNQQVIGVNTLIYRLRAGKIWIAPLPQAGQILQLIYVPTFTTLNGDSDTFDGISGWTEYVIVDASIKCLQKEESDVSVLMMQKAQLLERIESAAANRDAANPSTVADVQNNRSLVDPLNVTGWWYR